MTNDSFWQDPVYQDALVVLLCRDVTALKSCASLLHPDDFKPLTGAAHGRSRRTVAGIALEHWQKYHEPIGKLLNAGALDYAEQTGFGESQLADLREYCAILRKQKVLAPEYVVGKVVRFKQERIRAAVLQELSELQAANQLTDERWHEITAKVITTNGRNLETTDYVSTLPARLERRRAMANRVRRPWSYIEPLDNLITGLGPKELGLVLAPRKRGKTQFLHWMTVAYALQHLNVLLITLETPLHIVEDRLDSIITKIPIKSLNAYPNTTTQRFERWRHMLRPRQIKIYDGTQGGLTVQGIDHVLMAERDCGFLADALIVDYDDEIKPAVKQRDRRFEFADIYRELRQLISRRNLIGWTGAQTNRGTEHLKIIGENHVAEDISKLNKVNLALSLGKGDWEDGESIYLWVTNANNEAQHVGCHIIPDKKRTLIYDAEATARAAKRNQGT